MSFIHSFIQQIFIGYQNHARSYEGPWNYSREADRHGSGVYGTYVLKGCYAYELSTTTKIKWANVIEKNYSEEGRKGFSEEVNSEYRS